MSGTCWGLGALSVREEVQSGRQGVNGATGMTLGRRWAEVTAVTEAWGRGAGGEDHP